MNELPPIGVSPRTKLRHGDRVTFRHPDGTTKRGVITEADDGTFTIKPEPPAEFGWIVPSGTEICPRCGDQNFEAIDRVCITCTPGRQGHDPELLERLLRLRAQGWRP